tara:strand:+ start:673 stop:1176 length:504 start_codon:yes stop_codon:yes gene_type:complete
MKNTIFLFFVFYTLIGYTQNKYVNEDGTVSNFAKRQLAVDAFNKQSTDETHYSIEDNYFIVITKSDCGNAKYEPTELQQKAMYSSFIQLNNQISKFKQVGYNAFSDIEFEGIIFKTNTICMLSTRRYHFKFTFEELNSFPEFMDIQELMTYVVVTNKNQNVILVKNK